MKLPVISLDNARAGEIELSDAIFGLEPRGDILARIVDWQRAKTHRGTHKTKVVWEIRGSTRKPYKQKGTGQARAGQMRSAPYRGGQTTFGPVVRSHAYDLTKKVRKLALKHALSAKQRDGKLVVLDAATVAAPKTKALAEKVAALGWRSALVIDGQAIDKNFQLAARNIRGLDVLPQQGANAYDMLRHEILVLTRSAVEALEERLK